MIINPNLTLEQAAEYRLSQMGEQTNSDVIWRELSGIEKEMLKAIAKGQSALYSKEMREQFAQALGVENISSSSLQGKVRKLERAELLTRDTDGMIKINNPHFQTWIIENQEI